MASCSYEARQFGVHSAMPSRMAKQLCPHAIFIRGDMDQYSKYSKEVTEIIEADAPLFEKASIDEHYLDISGMEKYVKTSMLWTHELREKIIRETGLPISFGLSENKTVSKIATGESKPNGEKQILHGLEKSFLAPLSIRKIPGIGEKTATDLLQEFKSVKKIKTLTERELTRIIGASKANIVWRYFNEAD